MKQYLVIVIVVLLAVIIFSLTPQNRSNNNYGIENNSSEIITFISTTFLPSGEKVKYIIPSSDIVFGGPPKDGIPSINTPIFVSADEGYTYWL